MKMTSRRAFSTVIQPTKDDIWHLSRGNIGRRVFAKGWKHLTPRYPINLQVSAICRYFFFFKYKMLTKFITIDFGLFVCLFIVFL